MTRYMIVVLTFLIVGLFVGLLVMERPRIDVWITNDSHTMTVRFNPPAQRLVFRDQPTTAAVFNTEWMFAGGPPEQVLGQISASLARRDFSQWAHDHRTEGATMVRVSMAPWLP